MITNTPKAGFWTTKMLRRRSRDPLAAVGDNVQISADANIYYPRNVTIGNNVRIDDFTVIVANAVVAIGNCIHIAHGCVIQAGGGFVMEDFTALSSGTRVITASDNFDGDYVTNPMVPVEYRRPIADPVILRQHAICGAMCTVLPGVTLGEGAVLAAGGVATRDIPAWEIWGGVPARKLKDRKRGVLYHQEALGRVATADLA